ncbi:2936_t:CDS:2, partial [Gigaspora rosea]
DHRLDKNGPLLPLSGVKEITQPPTVQLDSSQSTLPELFNYLSENEAILKHPIVHDVRDEIELSFGNRWDKPGVEGYIATILDPRFKDLSFEQKN